MKARPDPSTKPYYRCLSCKGFGVTCGGHSTRDMSLKEWCEYMRDVKEAKHLKNADIAAAADTSVKTIEKIMAITYDDKDIRRGTARRIEKAVIGISDQYPCYLDYEDSTVIEQNSKLREELEYWRKENERKAKIIDKLLEK
jgi:predicted Ser/Thr protein kinase